MNLIYQIQSDELAAAIESELIFRYSKEVYLMNLNGCYAIGKRNDVINCALPIIKDNEVNKHIIHVAIKNIKEQILIYGQK